MQWDERSRLNWRAALRLRPLVVAAREARHSSDLPTVLWSALVRSFTRSRALHHRLWETASRQVDEEAIRALAELNSALDLMRAGLRRRLDEMPMSSVSEVWRDLEALCDEFEEVDVDLKAKEIRVVTESVVLEGIDLGRFRIILEWTSLGQRHPYWVEALDPCPAESNPHQHHPHITDTILCEGDGQHAIRQALEQGRLLDFFVLVRQILRNYNAGSAYVKLANWQGNPCQGCGYLADQDECYTCACCRDVFCGDCTRGCSSCLDSTCDGCCRLCRCCENCYCSSCMSTCTQCESESCESCLHDGRCPDCLHPEPDEEETDHDDSAKSDQPKAIETGAEIHAICLGEVGVPA